MPRLPSDSHLSLKATRRRGAFPAAAFLGSALTALAAADTVTQAPLPGPDVGSSIARLLGALGIVLALFFGGVWLSRNWQRFTRNAGRSSDLRVLDMKSLGPRQAVWVVGFQRQRFLVGSSAAGVQLLAELPQAAEIEPMPQPAAQTVDFAEAFRRVLSRGGR
jgi:flagellar biosynthetic protein FliO